MKNRKFQTYMRNQVREISTYRETFADRCNRDISRNEAASRWIREFAEGFNAKYIKKLPCK